MRIEATDPGRFLLVHSSALLDRVKQGENALKEKKYLV
jgi:hypothetical protein